jgi:hypothetical protein
MNSVLNKALLLIFAVVFCFIITLPLIIKLTKPIIELKIDWMYH